MKVRFTLMKKDIIKMLENTNIVKEYMQNGFKVSVRQERLSQSDRKMADSYMRKQFLEYT